MKGLAKDWNGAMWDVLVLIGYFLAGALLVTLFFYALKELIDLVVALFFTSE